MDGKFFGIFAFGISAMLAIQLVYCLSVDDLPGKQADLNLKREFRHLGVRCSNLGSFEKRDSKCGRRGSDNLSNIRRAGMLLPEDR